MNPEQNPDRETVPCNICGSMQTKPYLTLRDRFTGDLFRIVNCDNCGLKYLNPRPSKSGLAHYYPKEYEPYATKGTGSFNWHGRRMRHLQLNFVERFRPARGNLLDVGSATGNFLTVARDRGWSVHGIEISEEAASIAKVNYNLETLVGAVEDVLQDNEIYDVITMWDVLEHLRDPMGVLSKCHQALKPGGFIIMSIPNLDSYDRYLFGASWVGWEIPRHFYFFDEHTLARLLSEIGLAVIATHSFIGGRGVFELSMQTKFATGMKAKLANVTLPALLAITWPYRKLSYQSGKGSILTFVAEKSLLKSNTIK